MNWLLEKLYRLKKKCGVFWWSCIVLLIFPIIALFVIPVLALPAAVMIIFFTDVASKYSNNIEGYFFVIVLLGIVISLVVPFCLPNLGRKRFEENTTAQILDLTRKIEGILLTTDLNMQQILSLRNLLFTRASLYNDLGLKEMATADMVDAQKFDS